MSNAVVLLRTQRVSRDTTDLARELADASGCEVALVVDERVAEQPQTDLPKISLNRDSYASLGLYVPADVAWKCGDYGLYLARRRFPNADRFWMFEDDVRISGSAPRFFSELAALDHDLLVGWLEPAEEPWHWVSFSAARDADPFACRFPVVRLSAAALDLLYRKRVEHSRRASRRWLWPNDETFVATTIMNSDLTAADFNDFGRAYYDRVMYDVWHPVEIEVGSSGPPTLLHPVARKGTTATVALNPRYQAPPAVTVRWTRAVLRRVNQRLSW